jgi:hypothetical protein
LIKEKTGADVLGCLIDVWKKNWQDSIVNHAIMHG